VKVYNPAFDVTPASLVTGYITEKGVFDNKQISEFI
ncbi:MAG: S-methyl-5-thioribose-1-phosphate isomerase, partial [Clostridia bacterium]|nr:S-methyl-5-thioribose-1-phosphate isomerase [Clostridia bacterium]